MKTLAVYAGRALVALGRTFGDAGAAVARLGVALVRWGRSGSGGNSNQDRRG